MSQHFKAEVLEDSDLFSEIKLDQRYLLNTRKDISKATTSNNNNNKFYTNSNNNNNSNNTNTNTNNMHADFIPMFDRRKENSIRFTESTLNAANDFLAASAAD